MRTQFPSEPWSGGPPPCVLMLALSFRSIVKHSSLTASSYCHAAERNAETARSS
jgi:hypothetical protein